MHNGTYGRAVRDQCQNYYDKELSKIYTNTIHEIGATDLENAIGFYSFDYKSSGKVIYDGIKSQSFELFLEQWKESKNYFFIIGYEPNISLMLEYMDEKFKDHQEIEKCLIFCGTASMPSWKESIINTLKKSKTLEGLIERSYYLKLLMYSNRNNPFINGSTKELNIDFYKYTKEMEYEKVDLEKTLMNILHISDRGVVENHLNYYLEKEESYISIFSTLSILIAQYSIKKQTSLLKSKSKVLYEYKDEIDILVNGDSINQYVVSSL